MSKIVALASRPVMQPVEETPKGLKSSFTKDTVNLSKIRAHRIF
jgi:hypothetical protein